VNASGSAEWSSVPASCRFTLRRSIAGNALRAISFGTCRPCAVLPTPSAVEHSTAHAPTRCALLRAAQTPINICPAPGQSRYPLLSPATPSHVESGHLPTLSNTCVDCLIAAHVVSSSRRLGSCAHHFVKKVGLTMHPTSSPPPSSSPPGALLSTFYHYTPLLLLIQLSVASVLVFRQPHYPCAFIPPRFVPLCFSAIAIVVLHCLVPNNPSPTAATLCDICELNCSTEAHRRSSAPSLGE